MSQLSLCAPEPLGRSLSSKVSKKCIRPITHPVASSYLSGCQYEASPPMVFRFADTFDALRKMEMLYELLSSLVLSPGEPVYRYR